MLSPMLSYHNLDIVLIDFEGTVTAGKTRDIHLQYIGDVYYANSCILLDRAGIRDPSFKTVTCSVI